MRVSAFFNFLCGYTNIPTDDIAFDFQFLLTMAMLILQGIRIFFVPTLIPNMDKFSNNLVLCLLIGELELFFIWKLRFCGTSLHRIITSASHIEPWRGHYPNKVISHITAILWTKLRRGEWHFLCLWFWECPVYKWIAVMLSSIGLYVSCHSLQLSNSVFLLFFMVHFFHVFPDDQLAAMWLWIPFLSFLTSFISFPFHLVWTILTQTHDCFIHELLSESGVDVPRDPEIVYRFVRALRRRNDVNFVHALIVYADRATAVKVIRKLWNMYLIHRTFRTELVKSMCDCLCPLCQRTDHFLDVETRNEVGHPEEHDILQQVLDMEIAAILDVVPPPMGDAVDEMEGVLDIVPPPMGDAVDEMEGVLDIVPPPMGDAVDEMEGVLDIVPPPMGDAVDEMEGVLDIVPPPMGDAVPLDIVRYAIPQQLLDMEIADVLDVVPPPMGDAVPFDILHF